MRFPRPAFRRPFLLLLGTLAFGLLPALRAQSFSAPKMVPVDANQYGFNAGVPTQLIASPPPGNSGPQQLMVIVPAGPSSFSANLIAPGSSVSTPQLLHSEPFANTTSLQSITSFFGTYPWPAFFYASSNAGGSTTPLRVAIENPDGTYTPPYAITVPFTAPAAANLAYVTAFFVDTPGNPQLALEDTANGLLYTLAYSGEPGSTQPTLTAYTLASQVPIPSADGPGPIAIGDLNHDGRQDLILNGQTGQSATVFLSNPDSTLQPPIRYTFDNGVSSLLLHDLDNDGTLDLVLTDSTGNVEVFHGNGDGTFASTPLARWPNTLGANGKLLAVADLNNDGIPDLLLGSPAGVSILLGSKTGAYTLQATYLAGGGHTWAVADFDGDGRLDVANDAPGGIALLYGQAATPATPTVTASPEPSNFEEAFTLTASGFDNLASGATVTFTATSAAGVTTSLGSSAVSNGSATLDVPLFPAGSATTASNPLRPATYTVTATYQAGPNLPVTAQATGSHTISRGPTEVTLMATTPPTTSYGGPVNGTFTIQVVDLQNFPDIGNYTVFDNNQPVAICTNIPVTVNGQPNNCPYGYPNPLPPGPHALAVQYLGDPINAPSAISDAIAYTVFPDTTTTTVMSSSNPAALGTAVTFTASVQGNILPATGTVSFFDNGSMIGAGTLNANGLATFTTSTLALGTHPITAGYAATQDFSASSSQVFNQVINPPQLATTTTLQSSLNPSPLGQSITFTATVTSAQALPGQQQTIPAGTVTFLDNGVSIGTGQLNPSGAATFATSTLTAGTHPITASYPGETLAAAVLSPSTSAPLSQAVQAPTFTLSLTPSPVTVEAGADATLLVNVTDTSGLGAVTLACTNLPFETQCLFSPSGISGSGTSVLTLVTTGPRACGSTAQHYGAPSARLTPSCTHPARQESAQALTARRGFQLGGPALAALLLLLPASRRRLRRTPSLLLLAIAMLAGLVTLNGCGNCTDLGTRPGTYTFTVAASPAVIPVTTPTAAAAADAPQSVASASVVVNVIQ